MRSFLLGLALVLSAPAARAAPMFMGLGTLPGGGASIAYGVSADGSTVVGYAASQAGTATAFRWTASGGMVGLGDLADGSLGSVAEGVSADGSVVVGGVESQLGGEAFRWTSQGGMVGLGDLPGGIFASGALDVSADGSVAVGVGSPGSPRREAFRWTSGGGMVGLGGLVAGGSSGARGVSADGSVVVGEAQTPSGSEAFLWTESGGMVGLGELAGGDFHSGALAVSADGSAVVGRSSSAAEPGGEAFRWTASGGMVGLGDLPDASFVLSQAMGVSADGSVIVGQGSDTDSNYRAFIWEESHGMRLLQDVLVNEYGLDLTGWTLGNTSGLGGAWGISDDGRTIVGTGLNPSGQIEAWIAVLPEPGTGEPSVVQLLHDFDAAVADGTLVGSGPGNSALGRLGALRNFIEAAGNLIEAGSIDEACGQLRAAQERSDAISPPPDFVGGSSAPELYEAIRELRESLGCL